MSADLDARIALVRGWKDLKPNTFWESHYDFTGIPPGELRTYVPRWSSSLDLMWELEDGMSQDELREYIRALLRVVAPGPDPSNWGYGVHATAEQKAEAWLKIKEGG